MVRWGKQVCCMHTVIKVVFEYHMFQRCKWGKISVKIIVDIESVSDSNKLKFLHVFATTRRYDREETELTLDNNRHLIKLHDTAGQEDYERLRKMIYKDVNRVSIFTISLCKNAQSSRQPAVYQSSDWTDLVFFCTWLSITFSHWYIFFAGWLLCSLL